MNNNNKLRSITIDSGIYWVQFTDYEIYVSRKAIYPDDHSARLLNDINQGRRTDIAFCGVGTTGYFEGTCIKDLTFVPASHNELSPPVLPRPTLPTCQHEWKYYQGLTDSYEYCCKCDVKRSEVEEITTEINPTEGEYYLRKRN